MPKGVRAGTRTHIAAIIRIHDILDAHQRAAAETMIFPLMSQPVLEACLSIPSWHWSEGGRDRAVARAAFAGRLPPRVLRRSNKGVLNSLLLPALERARTDMRALLCDGLLARRGLLDREKIASALSRPISEQPDIYGRILVLIDAELWVSMVASADESALLDR
jgi:asparagine synthase (glutamine-hydrolysing)